jgi:hypothetical protein
VLSVQRRLVSGVTQGAQTQQDHLGRGVEPVEWVGRLGHPLATNRRRLVGCQRPANCWNRRRSLTWLLGEAGACGCDGIGVAGAVIGGGFGRRSVDELEMLGVSVKCCPIGRH